MWRRSIMKKESHKQEIVSKIKKVIKRFIQLISENKYTIIYGILFILYAKVSLKILLYHDSYCNEAQAWLISKNLNFWGIYKQMYWEGHPCLWHWILMPFAHLGFPYHTMNFISWGICLLTVLLMFKKSPLSPVANAIITFSVPLLYNYSALSRNYCLIPLALTLLAINYKSRHDHPIRYILLILLLAWTHVVMWGMVGGLLILFYYEEIIKNHKTNTKEQKKKVYLSLLIIIAGLLFMLIPIGLGVSHNYLVRKEHNIEKFYILGNMATQIFPAITNLQPYVYILLGITIVFGLYELIFYHKSFIILLFTFGFNVWVYYYVYYASDQRLETFIFVIMFIFWIQTYEGKPKAIYRKILNFCMAAVGLSLVVLNLISTKDWIEVDVDFYFSDAQNIARYIKREIPNGTRMMSLTPSTTSSIVPYIPDEKNIRFYDIITGEDFTYAVWKGEYKDAFWPEINTAIAKDFADEDEIYIICAGYCDYVFSEMDQEQFSLELKYSTDYSWVESFNIWLVERKNEN